MSNVLLQQSTIRSTFENRGGSQPCEEGRQSQNIHIWEDSTSDFELLEIVIPAIENQMSVTINGGNVGMKYHLTIKLD